METNVATRVAAKMREQHGLISLEQLARLGVSRAQLRSAVAHGWLAPAGPRVYRTPAAPETLDHRRALGLLVLGPQAVISHRGAACLHRFDRSVDVVEFTIALPAHGARLPFPVHTTGRLPPIDRVVVDGFACTSATRTIIDLARLRVGRFELEAAIDSAVRLGLTAPAALRHRLEGLRGRGRWGCQLLDHLLIDSGGHTMLERRFLTLVRRAGLPRPTPQVIHRRDGRAIARVDFLFEDLGVVVEVSGRKGHSSPAERARDAQRRNELQEFGRLVYEYTWEQVDERSDWVADTLSNRLAQARRRLSTS
jgi:hypothetical protein